MIDYCLKISLTVIVFSFILANLGMFLFGFTKVELLLSFSATMFGLFLIGLASLAIGFVFQIWEKK